MKKAFNPICIILTVLFTTCMLHGSTTAGAVIKNTAAKKQLSIATTYVAVAENIVNTPSFSISVARASVTLAQQQIKKAASYGKPNSRAVKSLTNRISKITCKINNRVKQISASSAAALTVKNIASANLAVTRAEIIMTTDKNIFINNPTTLEDANKAYAAAASAVGKLNKASAEYKGFIARLTAINEQLISVRQEKEAAIAAANAEASVRSVEAAPLITAADITSIYELEKTAAAAIANVKDPNIAAGFNSRLKVVLDRAAALKAQLDAAAQEAVAPARLVSVNATDGCITVTFNKKPITLVSPTDFILTKAINGNSLYVFANGITVVNDTTVKISVPYTSPLPNLDQFVIYSVQYLSGSVMNTSAYSVPRIPPPTVVNVSSPNDRAILVTYSEMMDASAFSKGNYMIKDRNLNVVGSITSISSVPGQNNVYKLNLAQSLPGSLYTVIIDNVTNPYGISVSKTEKQVTINDTTPPLPPAAELIDPVYKSIRVSFSEAMDYNSITTRTDYQIALDGMHYTELDPGVSIIPAPDLKSVILDFPDGTDIVPGVSLLRTLNIRDQAGNYTTKITDSNIRITGKHLASLGVTAKTAIAVKGKTPFAGTPNIQRITINGSFSGAAERQVLTINNAANPGIPEINTLTISGGPAVSSGALAVTFCDGTINTTVNLSVTKGDSTGTIGTSIHNTLAGIYAITNAYNISDASGVVTFTAKIPAADKNVSISAVPLSGLNPGGDLSFKQTQVQAGSAPNLTAGGNITLKINGPSGYLIRTVTLPIPSGLNSTSVATRIAGELNNYVDVVSIYTITANSNTVFLQDKTLNQPVAASALSIIDTGTTSLSTAASIEITAPSSGCGTLIASLNGTSITIQLAPSDTTAALVAARVAAALNLSPAIGAAYISSASGPVITLTRKIPGYYSQIITLINGTAIIPPSKITTLSAGSDPKAGISQVNTIAIISPAAVTGTLTIQLSDGTINQTIYAAVTAGDNTCIVAQKIFSQLVNNVTVTNEYNISVTNSNIIFTKKVPAAPQNFKFTIK